MAAKLLSLQIPSGKTQSGAWFSTYLSHNGVLSPPARASQSLPCDGNETLIQDIDTCEWVGNGAWVLIALRKLQLGGFYDNPDALSDAVSRGAAWLLGQFSRNPAYPNLISLGTEGNISAYFGLLAAGKAYEAEQLGKAIFQFGWDPVQRRMKPGVLPADAATAIDVSGSWGVTFLRSIGRVQEALDSQGYAASTMRVSSFEGSMYGYGDIAGPYTPTVEFSAQAASAGIKDANLVMQQIAALQIPPNGSYPGAFPGAADHWSGGPLAPWNTTMAGVSPTAWAYLAQNRDPLLDLLVPTLSLSVKQQDLRTGNTLTLSARATPGSSAVVADVYIALQFPGCVSLACVQFWQGGLNFTTTAQPILRDWPVAFFAAPVFSYSFSGEEPAGSYRWLAAFAVPGTLNLIGVITQTSFTFVP